MTDRPPIAPAEAFFGVIQAGARERETTADIWGRIRDYAQTNNVSVPGDMFSEVNRMRGIASGLVRASESFAGADPSAPITADMIGTQLYQRSSADLQELASLYHVRFSMTTISALGPEQNWYTLDYGGSLPGTVGEMLDDVFTYGEGLGDTYGATFQSIDSIEIGAY